MSTTSGIEHAAGDRGLWQVGLRLDTDVNERAQLDLDYIYRSSLGLDAKILIQTIPAVLGGTGINTTPAVTKVGGTSWLTL